jgi:hypothetical protein
MDLPLSADYILHAVEKENDATAWDLWSGLYPQMMLGYIKTQDFADFKKSLFVKENQTSKKTHEEIQTEMMRVVAAYEGR